MFSGIQKYMGEVGDPLNQQQRTEVAQRLLHQGLKRPELKDELYMQVFVCLCANIDLSNGDVEFLQPEFALHNLSFGVNIRTETEAAPSRNGPGMCGNDRMQLDELCPCGCVLQWCAFLRGPGARH